MATINLETYSEIDRWIPPRFMDTSKSRPAAFAATTGKDAPWQKSPCNICGKLGHWKKHCPDAKKEGKAQASNSQETDTSVKGPKHKTQKTYYYYSWRTSHALTEEYDKSANL